MPKQKTHKGMKKRFKLTANGKAKHRKTNRGHMKSTQTPKQKRHLTKTLFPHSQLLHFPDSRLAFQIKFIRPKAVSRLPPCHRTP